MPTNGSAFAYWNPSTIQRLTSASRATGGCADSAHGVVDGHEHPTRSQMARTMSNHVDGIGQMHQKQSAHQRIERPLVPECPGVTTAEADVR
jgi:membrane protease subunit (stomatin/prohibitin family)